MIIYYIMNQSDLNLYHAIYNMQHDPSIKNWEMAMSLYSQIKPDNYTINTATKQLNDFARINQLALNTDTKRSATDNDLFGKFRTGMWDYTNTSDPAKIYGKAVSDISSQKDYLDILNSLKTNDDVFNGYPMSDTIRRATIDAVALRGYQLGYNPTYTESFDTKFSNHFDRGDYMDALNDLINQGEQKIIDGGNKIINDGGKVIGSLLDNPNVILALGIVLAIVILK